MELIPLKDFVESLMKEIKAKMFDKQYSLVVRQYWEHVAHVHDNLDQSYDIILGMLVGEGNVKSYLESDGDLRAKLLGCNLIKLARQWVQAVGPESLSETAVTKDHYRWLTEVHGSRLLASVALESIPKRSLIKFSELRPVLVRDHRKADQLVTNGIFHCFSTNYDEYQDGPASYPVAVVELEDGSVILPAANTITFTDR